MSGAPTPGGFLELLEQWGQQIAHAAVLASVGVVLGVAQLLRSKEALTVRIVAGRALTTGGLSMAAGAVLAWMPDIPLVAQIGIAATLASLGTSGLERLIGRLPIFGGGQ